LARFGKKLRIARENVSCQECEKSGRFRKRGGVRRVVLSLSYCAYECRCKRAIPRVLSYIHAKSLKLSLVVLLRHIVLVFRGDKQVCVKNESELSE